MYYRYRYNRYVSGINTHIVEGFSTYTEENGLSGELTYTEATRATEALSGLDASPAQRTLLRELARDKVDSAIAMPDGTVKQY